MSFPKRRRKALGAKGWSQAELARRTDVSTQTISLWMRGVTEPTRANWPKVAKVLGWPTNFDSVRYGEVGDEETGQQVFLDVLQWGDQAMLVSTAKVRPKSVGVLPVEAGFPDAEDSYAVTVINDAMAPIVDGVGGIDVGDRIVVSKVRKPRRGSIVVARVGNSEPVLREYVPRGEAAYDLVATNEEFETMTVNKRNPGVIIGVVIRHERTLER